MSEWTGSMRLGTTKTASKAGEKTNWFWQVAKQYQFFPFELKAKRRKREGGGGEDKIKIEMQSHLEMPTDTLYTAALSFRLIPERLAIYCAFRKVYLLSIRIKNEFSIECTLFSAATAVNWMWIRDNMNMSKFSSAAYCDISILFPLLCRRNDSSNIDCCQCQNRFCFLWKSFNGSSSHSFLLCR